MTACTLAALVLAAGAAAPDDPRPGIIVVDRDNVEIRESCRVRIAAPFIADADGNGVLHVVAEGITVDFDGGRLHGAAPGTPADAFTGCGVRVTAPDVTLRNLSVSGFRAGVHATGADSLLLEDADVSGNFRQLLASTPSVEDTGDWLWPHENDGNEWLDRYGAGVYIEDSERVTLRRIRARRGQNGIVLDGVNGSRVYDNDCSFLSGWGIAMWRSSRNLVCRNAVDFCVRGYSHGVYNRGQDSAGILMFEQCSENTIAENSATHCGDGVFAFAGKEALGETSPRDDLSWYERRGNDGNVFFGNDLSYAVAHGLELTFSFDNRITANRMVGNAICGIWGGYSQDTLVLGNTFESNGEMGYGLERGGVNIEHGRGNRIEHNRFVDNACGVHLWWDPDEALMKLPWARVNERGSTDNVIQFNGFRGDDVGIHLRHTTNTTVRAAVMEDVAQPLRLEDSEVAPDDWDGPIPEIALAPPRRVGERQAVGDRKALRGREHIVMTEWGPYDWQEPLLQRAETTSRRHVYRLLGPEAIADVTLDAGASGRLERDPQRPEVFAVAAGGGAAVSYRVRVTTNEGSVAEAAGLLLPMRWSVRVFAWTADPREDVEAWRAEAGGTGATAEVEALRLVYGSGGPSDVDLGAAVRDAALPADRFGTIATARVTLPAGTYRLRTRSDDGIRVWVDGAMVIDDWTWHPPMEHVHELTIDDERTIELRVEHFELDGYAVLEAEIDRAVERRP